MALPFADLGTPVVDLLGAPEAIVVIRRAPGAHSETTGLWVSGESEEIPMDAHVQPATGRDIDALPEGDRAREVKAFYTREALRSSDVSSSAEGDVLRWGDRLYAVRRLEDWSAQAQYYRAVGVRIGP